jgi:hypothetical protein
LWVELVGDLVIARRRGSEQAPGLSRLAFGESDYRVFCNDIIAAVKWLREEPRAAPSI